MSTSQSFSKLTPSVVRGGGPGQDYWSIDDFLSTQERVPCRLDQPLYRLGFLDPHCPEEHLLPGVKMEFPLWLAKALCTRKRRVLSVQYPRAYKDMMRHALQADPTVIDLNRNGPYYYTVGLYLLQFDLPENKDLAKTLLETFVKRFRYIMDSAHHAYLHDTTKLTNHLDEIEKYLFALGQEALLNQTNWESGRSSLIGMSRLVDSSSRKRKRHHDNNSHTQ